MINKITYLFSSQAAPQFRGSYLAARVSSHEVNAILPGGHVVSTPPQKSEHPFIFVLKSNRAIGANMHDTVSFYDVSIFVLKST